MSSKRHDNVTFKQAHKLGYTGPRQPGWRYSQDVKGVWYATFDLSQIYKDYAAAVETSRTQR